MCVMWLIIYFQNKLAEPTKRLGRASDNQARTSPSFGLMCCKPKVRPGPPSSSLGSVIALNKDELRYTVLMEDVKNKTVLLT
jgi:hypothetical protein